MVGRTVSPRFARVVIVVPPTDHYRTYVIEGDIKSCISKPLRSGDGTNPKPCGPKCPARKYQQLPRDSGIVQHHPPFAPQIGWYEETEQEPLKQDLENSCQPSNANSIKRSRSEIPKPAAAKRRRSSVTNIKTSDGAAPRRSLAKTAKTAKEARRAKIQDSPIIRDSHVVLEHLDLPNGCRTVRLVQIDTRLKEALDSRLLVDTPRGELLVTPVQDQKLATEPDDEDGSELVLAPPEMEEVMSNRCIEDNEHGIHSQEPALPMISTTSEPEVTARVPSRASIIRKSLSIAVSKPKPKRRTPKKPVPVNTTSLQITESEPDAGDSKPGRRSSKRDKVVADEDPTANGADHSLSDIFPPELDAFCFQDTEGELN